MVRYSLLLISRKFMNALLKKSRSYRTSLQEIVSSARENLFSSLKYPCHLFQLKFHHSCGLSIFSFTCTSGTCGTKLGDLKKISSIPVMLACNKSLNKTTEARQSRIALISFRNYKFINPFQICCTISILNNNLRNKCDEFNN